MSDAKTAMVIALLQLTLIVLALILAAIAGIGV
jgi:hypothetical protein